MEKGREALGMVTKGCQNEGEVEKRRKDLVKKQTQDLGSCVENPKESSDLG